MESYCLSCIPAPDAWEIALARCISLGMTGCQEVETPLGTESKCFFKNRAARDAAEAELRGLWPGLAIKIFEVPEQDWNAKWKESMEPVQVAPGVWVSPKWLPPPLSENDHWIKIEPKMAFGTGHHATTRRAAAAVQKISKMLPGHFSILDIGCGAGVLCFVAELYGAGKTLGIDIDAVCAENLAENRRENPCGGHSNAFAIGTLDMLRGASLFDCIVMNMISAESEPLLKHVFSLLKSGAILIWSGLLIEEKNTVISHASQQGFSLSDESFEEEWWCGVFKKTT